jgi:alkylation response protein AidB-like acyl-CoA dehydrogenase
MDFTLPPELSAYLAELDQFIEDEIKPLQAQDDNERFFDHRREWARTDWDNGGLPRTNGKSFWQGPQAGRRRRAPALRLAQGVRRQGRLQPVDGGDPRASGQPRAWACSTTCRTSTRSSATIPSC